jgi:hypothetical protein
MLCHGMVAKVSMHSIAAPPNKNNIAKTSRYFEFARLTPITAHKI